MKHGIANKKNRTNKNQCFYINLSKKLKKNLMILAVVTFLAKVLRVFVLK